MKYLVTSGIHRQPHSRPAERVLSLLESRPVLENCRPAVAGYEIHAVLNKIEPVNQTICQRFYGKTT